MIILVGLCLAVMTFLHWVLEPLEVVMTPFPVSYTHLTLPTNREV